MIHTSSPEQAAPGSPGAPAAISIFFCGTLRELGGGLDLDRIAWWLQETQHGTQVAIVRDLCDRPEAIANSPLSQATAAVLGLCSGDYREAEFQRSCRRKGIDPLRIAFVNLGAYCAVPLKTNHATSKAKVLLAAAVAASQRFSGSSPEAVRPYVLTEGHRISRRALFTMPPIAYRPVATIDADRCQAESGCRACVKACPVEALTGVDGKIEITRRSCEACGMCQSACPTSAAALPGRTLSQVEAEVMALLSGNGADDRNRRAILFVCRRIAATVDSLAETSDRLPEWWYPVDIPCAGSVSPAMILQTLAFGAGAVGVLGCGDACPYDQHVQTQSAVEYCQEIMRSLDLPAEAVRFFDTSAGPNLLSSQLSSPLPDGSWHDGLSTLSFAGPDATAGAIAALAQVAGTDGLTMDHAHSPLGSISVQEDACTSCGSCALVCPTGALRRSANGVGVALSFDPNLCTGCAECANVCPESIITVSRSVDLRRLRAGRIDLCKGDIVRCELCGESFAPAAMLRRIVALLEEKGTPTSEGTMRAITHTCATCRGIGKACSKNGLSGERHQRL